MEIKQTKPLSRQRKIIWTIVCATLAMACIYCQIFIFPWGNDDLIGAFALLLILVILVVWFKFDFKGKFSRFIPILMSLCIAVSLIVATSELRKMYIEDQVAKYGVITHGEIVNLYVQYHLKRSNRNLATLAYRVNGQVFYSDLDNKKKKIQRRDRVKLIYSSKNPHIISVMRIDKPLSDEVEEHRSASKNHLKGVPRPLTFMDSAPLFPGDMPGLYAYLKAHVKYPQEARNQGISGKVFISFVIAKDGSVEDVKVEKGIGGGCDEAAIETVANMPKWRPGMQNGKPVRVKYNIPISFSL